MISLVTGSIGSGKTLYSVGGAVRHISRGGTVYSNVKLNYPEVAELVLKRHRRIIEADQIREVDLIGDKAWHLSIEWGTPEMPVLVLLDEIHLFFNARDWAKTQKLHSDMLSFLSQSRKACVDVVFIAQVAGTLEKQFREQCEWEFFCRAMREIHIPILGTLPLNRMLLVQRDKNTDKPVRRQILAYDKGLWGCYDTLAFFDKQMLDASAAVPRVGKRKLRRPPVLTRSRWVSIGLVAVLALYFYLSTK